MRQRVFHNTTPRRVACAINGAADLEKCLSSFRHEIPRFLPPAREEEGRKERNRGTERATWLRPLAAAEAAEAAAAASAGRLDIGEGEKASGEGAAAG